jgi:hypothetical protein
MCQDAGGCWRVMEVAAGAGTLSLKRGDALLGPVLGVSCHHSGPDNQYAALAFGERLRASGVLSSLGQPGDAGDTALAGALFATFKSELAAIQPWPACQAARSAVFDDPECWDTPSDGTQRSTI